MLKKTITYTDYNGNVRTEDHYFNLTRAELAKMFASIDGGLDKYLEHVMASKSSSKIMEMIDRFIRASYGQKSLDGRRFMKSDEIYREFEESGAYDAFFTELFANDEEAARFINEVVPSNIAKMVAEETNRRKAELTPLPPPGND